MIGALQPQPFNIVIFIHMVWICFTGLSNFAIFVEIKHFFTLSLELNNRKEKSINEKIDMKENPFNETFFFVEPFTATYKLGIKN